MQVYGSSNRHYMGRVVDGAGCHEDVDVADDCLANGMIWTTAVRDASQFASPPDLQPNAFVQRNIESQLVDHVDKNRKREDKMPSITTLRRAEIAISAHKELARHPEIWKEALLETGFVGPRGTPDVSCVPIKKWAKGTVFRPPTLPTVTRSYIAALSAESIVLQPMKYPLFVEGYPNVLLNPMFVGSWTKGTNSHFGEAEMPRIVAPQVKHRY
jgi:hypothetical protein